MIRSQCCGCPGDAVSTNTPNSVNCVLPCTLYRSELLVLVFDKKSYSNDFVPCRRVQNQTRIATTVRSVSRPRGCVCQFNVKSQNLCIDRTNLTFLCMLDF